MKIKATKTDKYAQDEPHKPILFLMSGMIYDVPLKVAKRIVELEGAEFVKDEIETPVVDDIETPVVDDIETPVVDLALRDEIETPVVDDIETPVVDDIETPVVDLALRDEIETPVVDEIEQPEQPAESHPRENTRSKKDNKRTPGHPRPPKKVR